MMKKILIFSFSLIAFFSNAVAHTDSQSDPSSWWSGVTYFVHDQYIKFMLNKCPKLTLEQKRTLTEKYKVEFISELCAKAVTHNSEESENAAVTLRFFNVTSAKDITSNKSSIIKELTDTELIFILSDDEQNDDRFDRWHREALERRLKRALKAAGSSFFSSKDDEASDWD